MKSRKMLIKLCQSELHVHHMHHRHVRPLVWTQAKLYARNANQQFDGAYDRNQKKISEDDKPMFLRMKEKAKNLFKGKGQKEEPEDDPNNFENQLKEEQDLIRQDEIAKKDAAVQSCESAKKINQQFAKWEIDQHDGNTNETVLCIKVKSALLKSNF